MLLTRGGGLDWCSGRISCTITYHGIMGSHPDLVEGFSYYLDFSLPCRVPYGRQKAPSAKRHTRKKFITQDLNPESFYVEPIILTIELSRWFLKTSSGEDLAYCDELVHQDVAKGEGVQPRNRCPIRLPLSYRFTPSISPFSKSSILCFHRMLWGRTVMPASSVSGTAVWTPS